MSRSFKISIQTYAYADVTVKISNLRLAVLATEYGKTIEDLTVEDLAEEISEKFDVPTICAKCSGWGEDYYLELGDDWNVTLSSRDAPLHTAISEVTE